MSNLHQQIKALFLVAAVSVLLLAAACGLVVAPRAFAVDGQDAQAPEDTKLVIGVPVGRSPLSYMDSKTGAIEGMGVDLCRLAAENAGYRPTFVALDEEETLKDALDDPRFDLVLPFGSSILSTSGQQALVTDNLMTTPFSLVTTSGHQPTSLINLKVGMIESQSGVASTVQESLPDCSIELFKDWDAAVSALRAGEIDGMLNNTYIWSYLLQKPSYSDLHVVPLTAFTMDYRAGVVDTPENAVLVSRLNAGIAQITTVQRQSVVLDYTSRNLYHNTIYDTLYESRGIIIAALVIVITIIICVALWMGQRKRYVATLKEANRRLERTNEKLEMADQARVAFLSGMSHDMRTPLNGIIGFTNFALETKDADLRQDYLEKISASGELMLDLVNDVLDLSKVASGKMVIKPEDFEARALFDSVIDTLRPQIETRDMELVTTMAEDFPRYVRADALRLRQISINLLSNAVNYTPDGGRIEFAVLMINEDENGCNTMISVADTGIGISEEFQERMFDPFSQECRSRTFGVQGTGLGLSIVKQIVELMRGTIEVESELDHGSTFRVKLPIEAVDAKGSPARKTRDAHVHADIEDIKGKCVLLVEDNDLNAEIASMIVQERGGLVVERAHDGKEGLDLFAQSERGYYDAILMDLRMPIMGGIDATKAIRALERRDAATIPIIAMTADAFVEDAENCLAAGMDAHVARPINPEKLLLTLCELIQGAGGESVSRR